jgi:hypothetical protein
MEGEGEGGGESLRRQEESLRGNLPRGLRNSGRLILIFWSRHGKQVLVHNCAPPSRDVGVHVHLAF